MLTKGNKCFFFLSEVRIFESMSSAGGMMPCTSCVFYEEIFFYLASLRRKPKYMGNIKRFSFFQSFAVFCHVWAPDSFIPLTCLLSCNPSRDMSSFSLLASHSTATTKMTTTATSAVLVTFDGLNGYIFLKAAPKHS